MGFVERDASCLGGVFVVDGLGISWDFVMSFCGVFLLLSTL